MGAPTTTQQQAADHGDDHHDPGPASFSGRTSTAAAANAPKQPKSRRGGAPLPMLPPEEARVRAIAEVVNALIKGVQEGRDVDLNDLKGGVSCVGWCAGLCRVSGGCEAGRQSCKLRCVVCL
jgi:hypothetical protein